MKRICLVANSTWFLYKYRSMIRDLLSSGLEVILIAPMDRYVSHFSGVPRLHLIHLQYVDASGKNPVRDFLLYREIKGHFKRLRPDLIFSFTIKPNIYSTRAAKKLNLTCVPSITGLGYTFSHGSLLRSIATQMYRFSLGSAESIIFRNREDLKLFQKLGITQASQKLIVQGVGIDLQHFQAREKTSQEFTFLFVGRILSDKGVREFVSAARSLKSWGLKVRCALLGPLDAKNPTVIPQTELAQWLAEGVVEYYGKTDDVRPFLAQCDVFVLPSYREGLSTAILEAMAMEKPIITTDAPGCKDAIDENCGWTVPIRNTEALTQAMKTAYEKHPQELQAMGKAGRIRVQHQFKQADMNQMYLDFVKAHREAVPS